MQLADQLLQRGTFISILLQSLIQAADGFVQTDIADRLQDIIGVSMLKSVDRVFIVGSDKHDPRKRLVVTPLLG